MQERVNQLMKKYNQIGTSQLYEERKYNQSLENIIRALQCAELIEDWSEVVYNKILIGHVYIHSLKDISYAREIYTEALEMIADLNKKGITLKKDYLYLAKYGLARSLRKLGELELAIPMLEEIIAEETDLSRKINVINDLGLTYWCKANLTKNNSFLDLALITYDQALKYCTEAGFLDDKAMILNNIGMVYYDKHQYDLAINSYEEALLLTTEEYYIACTSNEVAKTYIKLGNFPMAKKFINKANQILIDYDEAVAEIELLRNLAIEGLYQRKIGNFEDAVKFFEIAATKLEDRELKIEAAETFHQLSLMLKEQGDIRSGRYALRFEELAMEIEEQERVLKVSTQPC